MWIARRSIIREDWSEKVAIELSGREMSFAEVIAGWRDDPAFRAFFIAALAETPFPGFLWETPSIRRGGTGIAYEHVAIRSYDLERATPDAEAFESELENVKLSGTVAAFRNLGGDALLLAPRQIAGSACYGHLGAFVRGAPTGQRHALFQALGDAICETFRTSDDRIWISTSGLGVPWLHLRIDAVPKYYQHQPYRNV